MRVFEVPFVYSFARCHANQVFTFDAYVYAPFRSSNRTIIRLELFLYHHQWCLLSQLIIYLYRIECCVDFFRTRFLHASVHTFIYVLRVMFHRMILFGFCCISHRRRKKNKRKVCVGLSAKHYRISAVANRMFLTICVCSCACSARDKCIFSLWFQFSRKCSKIRRTKFDRHTSLCDIVSDLIHGS